MSDKGIVKADSKAYGYNYASLADIAKQDFKIPEMRIKPTEFGDYIEYRDSTGEWQTGAKIVVPEMKGMNAAQAYGSALTYARRYTAQMALALACDDDQKLEKAKPTGKTTNKSSYATNSSLATEKQLDFLKRLLERLDFPADEVAEKVAAARKQTAKVVSAGIKKYQDEWAKRADNENEEYVPDADEVM